MILKPSGIGEFFAGFSQVQHQECLDLLMLTDFLSEVWLRYCDEMNGERDSFEDEVHVNARCPWPFR